MLLTSQLYVRLFVRLFFCFFRLPVHLFVCFFVSAFLCSSFAKPLLAQKPLTGYQIWLKFSRNVPYLGRMNAIKFRVIMVFAF